MTWTTEYPTKPGFYWIRNYSIHAYARRGPDVVKVVQLDPRILEFAFTGMDNLYRESVLDYAEWQGPIEPEKFQSDGQQEKAGANMHCKRCGAVSNAGNFGFNIQDVKPGQVFHCYACSEKL